MFGEETGALLDFFLLDFFLDLFLNELGLVLGREVAHCVLHCGIKSNQVLGVVVLSI